MENTIRLSATIISFNEEENIGDCIDSIKEIADEIVVVDSFSTDNTKNICLEKGVRFVENPFEGHIQQKNFAIGLTNGDYIISLDADERLSEELKRSIATIKNDIDTWDGYCFNRLNNYCGHWVKHCGWYPDKKLRIWKKNRGYWGGNNPHDKLIMDKSASIKHLKGDLLHFSIKSIEEHIEKINYFSSEAAKSAFQNGKKINIFIVMVIPIVKFITNYFFKLGFLDGYYGFVICVNSAYSKYLKYLKLYQLHRDKIS